MDVEQAESGVASSLRRGWQRALPFADWGSLVLAVAGLWWVTTLDSGFRGSAQLVGIGALVPMYLMGRGWRLPWWLHVGALALPISILVIALAHDTGAGASRATRYAYGALALLAALAWSSTATRRVLLACGLIVVAWFEFAASWFLWWRGGDPGALVRGVFDWHNQQGAFMVGALAVALGLLVLGRGWVTWAGAFGVAFSATGVLLSGSRAALVLALVGLAVALAVGLLVRRWWAVLRLAGAALVGVTLAWLLRSSLFFPGSAAGGGGVVVDRGNSVESTFEARFDFWRVAAQMGIDHPLTGVGLGQYGPYSTCYGDMLDYSSHPHNEWLFGWAEGGIVGLLPLLAVLAVVVVLLVRSLLPWPRSVALAGDPARWGGLLAILLLMVHLAFDFDWYYPALVGLAGFTGALAGAPLLAHAVDRPAGRRRGGVMLGLVVVLLAAAVVGFAIDPLRELVVLGTFASPEAALCIVG